MSFPLVVDNTIMTAFRACPQKAFRTYIEHWKGRSTNVHLHAGKAFASGLEAARRAYYEQEQSPADSLAAGMQQLLADYGDYEAPADNAKSLLRMCQALEFYFDQWPLDTDTAKPMLFPSGRRAIEFSFAEPLEVLHPITGEPIIYTGRSDMVVEMASGLFIEDDKTTGQLGSSWFNQWDLRSQFTGYVWAAKRIDIPVSGVLVRGVGIMKTLFKAAQYLTYRAPWEIDRWYDQLHRDLERMIQCWKDDYWDYNLADSCSAYGGCSLRQVCKSPTPHEWLSMYFEQRRWDPLSRTEEPLGQQP